MFLREARNYYIERTLEMTWNGCHYSRVLGVCKTALVFYFIPVCEKGHTDFTKSLSHFIKPPQTIWNSCYSENLCSCPSSENLGAETSQELSVNCWCIKYFCYLCNPFKVDFAHSSLTPHCSTCWSDNVGLTLI